MSARSIFATARQRAIVRRSLIMAAIVGPTLTLINQGDALVSDAPFSPWKAGLTFIVPYVVATVSAVAHEWRRDHGTGHVHPPCKPTGAPLGSARPARRADERDSQSESSPMKARVHVTLKPGVLDPQGKAIAGALASLGFAGVGEVRQGKVIDLELTEGDRDKARADIEAMCRQLLANTVIEDYAIEMEG